MAVAARMAPLALGSDTGGSIRQPAALCGVLGVKPTYGTVSRYGLIAFASSLDQVGPFAHTPRDAARLLAVCSGRDPLDSTSVDSPSSDFEAETLAQQPRFRYTVPRECSPGGGGEGDGLGSSSCGGPGELSMPLLSW